VLETKLFKIVASFAAKNMDKKGVIGCLEVKNCYCMKMVLRKANFQKTEVQQGCNPSGHHQIPDVWWFSGLAQGW